MAKEDKAGGCSRSVCPWRKKETVRKEETKKAEKKENRKSVGRKQETGPQETEKYSYNCTAEYSVYSDAAGWYLPGDKDLFLQDDSVL